MQLSNGIAAVIGIVAIAILLIPLIIGGVFVIVVVANRADPDPSGRRPAVVYGFATAFVTLFITLFATTALVASLSDLIGKHHDSGSSGVFGLAASSGTSMHPVGDAVARGSVLSVLVAIVAGAVYWLHATAAARASAGAAAAEPVSRVRSSYVSAVSFVCVFIIVVATVVSAYDVFRIIAPGVFSPDTDGNRAVVVRSLIPTFYLALAAGALLLMHLRHAPPPMRPRYADRLPAGPLGGPAAQPEPTASAVVTPPPPMGDPAPTEELASPAPRRRAPRKTAGS